MQIRVGFAWMYPKEEDPTNRSFRAGIKYFLTAPRKPLSPNLKSGNAAISDSDAAVAGGAFPVPTILVPRKRKQSRGEKMISAVIPPLPPRRPKKKVKRAATPVNSDSDATALERDPGSRFQETLLEEGCGTQVIIRPHPYVFPAYSPGHRYNPHTSCKHVGPSRSIISLITSLSRSLFRYVMVMSSDAYAHTLSLFWTAVPPFFQLLIACVSLAWKSA
jgi:hypothetical protein